jgi:hypothetical protein
MLFYDRACGKAYIDTESDFPYRPSALFVMDGLIEACVAVRARIDARLTENDNSVNTLPQVPEDLQGTAAGAFLLGLSGTSSIEALDSLIKKFEQSDETIDDLQTQEARLRSGDTEKEQKTLTRQGEKLGDLRKHLVSLQEELGRESLARLQDYRAAVKDLEEAATALVRSLSSEPLSGVGSSPWKTLWESARRFSEQHAYPEATFPVVEVESRCVLCQQSLEAEGRKRLSRFESFVKDDTQVRLEEARQAHRRQVEQLTNLAVTPKAIENTLADLEPTHPDLVAEIRGTLADYESTKRQALDPPSDSNREISLGTEHENLLERLQVASNVAKATAEELDDPQLLQKKLQELTLRRSELEITRNIKGLRSAIVQEIERRKERDALDKVKKAAATGPITKKILEFSEESITEIVRDTFTRETDRLHLQRVTMARTRGDKGILLHQPKLVGARQKVTLPRVFSEGERSALGLAAFFTEAQLDASNSAIVLDDPVTSLDHIHRGLVAARLSRFSTRRQVIVFTHDVSFVADLKREAKAQGVPITERSVTKSRAHEGKPGACNNELPWKAKDVPSRFEELRQKLARIKRNLNSLDEESYEAEVALWAGDLSETWERIFSQEIIGTILAEGGLEVRPSMVKVLARFTESDQDEFQTCYSRVSQWAKRHDKSPLANYVAPNVSELETELDRVDRWFKRVKGYKNQ